ncbi:MAG: hypothetical protein LLF94_05760, partial [Chlamydiales bacterium]|nr:hypothetical protein [Chlamydiales bacterium]
TGIECDDFCFFNGSLFCSHDFLDQSYLTRRKINGEKEVQSLLIDRATGIEAVNGVLTAKTASDFYVFDADLNLVHKKNAIVDELLRQVPRVFTKCEKTIQILEGRPDEWKKYIGRIRARNVLFTELDRLAAKEQITADDIERAERIASQANFMLYHNAFFDLAELLAEKPGCREAALDMYGLVVHASCHRERIYETLAPAYRELAREVDGEDALRLIKKALQVALNMKKSDREQAIQQIASVYLGQSVEEKRIVPQHTFDIISQAEHIPAEWVLQEFDRIKKRLRLEAEVEALKAQNTALIRCQDELFTKLQKQEGNK